MGAGARPEGSDLAEHDVDKLSSSSSDAAQLEDVEDEGTWAVSYTHLTLPTIVGV